MAQQSSIGFDMRVSYTTTKDNQTTMQSVRIARKVTFLLRFQNAWHNNRSADYHIRYDIRAKLPPESPACPIQMHKLPSSSSVRRFRIASLLLCGKCVMTPLAGAFLVYAILRGDQALVFLALGAIGLTILMVVLQWLVSARTQCPLCLTPVLANKHCMKHREARTFLGSYRLRVAIGVILSNSFRCPYCNEPTRVEVRQRNRGNRGTPNYRS
jgi:hypothetical protein